MRHIPAEPPAFFHRGPSPLARLTFFGLISLVLLFADARFRYLEHVRYVAGIVLAPVQRVIVVPRDAVQHVVMYFADQQQLLKDKQDLERKLLEQAPLV